MFLYLHAFNVGRRKTANFYLWCLMLQVFMPDGLGYTRNTSKNSLIPSLCCCWGYTLLDPKKENYCLSDFSSDNWWICLFCSAESVSLCFFLFGWSLSVPRVEYNSIIDTLSNCVRVCSITYVYRDWVFSDSEKLLFSWFHFAPLVFTIFQCFAFAGQ